jgi:hypothetical protein
MPRHRNRLLRRDLVEAFSFVWIDFHGGKIRREADSPPSLVSFLLVRLAAGSEASLYFQSLPVVGGQSLRVHRWRPFFSFVGPVRFGLHLIRRELRFVFVTWIEDFAATSHR